MIDTRLETDAQPRFETDIYATLYIATANAISATEDVRDTTETWDHLTDELSRRLEGMQCVERLEAQMNTARYENERTTK